MAQMERLLYNTQPYTLIASSYNSYQYLILNGREAAWKDDICCISYVRCARLIRSAKCTKKYYILFCLFKRDVCLCKLYCDVLCALLHSVLIFVQVLKRGRHGDQVEII